MNIGDLVEYNGKQGRVKRLHVLNIRKSAQVQFIDGNERIFTGAQFSQLTTTMR